MKIAIFAFCLVLTACSERGSTSFEAVFGSGDLQVTVNNGETPAPLELTIRPHFPAVEGLQISTTNLRDVALRAQRGETPYAENIRALKVQADSAWAYGDVGQQYVVQQNGADSDTECSLPDGSSSFETLTQAGEAIYARVLMWYFSDHDDYAEQARRHLLAFTESSGFTGGSNEITFSGENQCAFEVGLLIPMLIESALLLELSTHWGSEDKKSVQLWLAETIYPLTASLARTRKNNWGNSSAFASWAIAHYLIDSGLVLRETHPWNGSTNRSGLALNNSIFSSV